jgi:hypothetical protein
MNRANLACVVFLIGLTVVASESSADEGGQGAWKVVFDGKSLAGWKANEHPEDWTIEDGVLVGRGPRSHLFYVAEEVRDFELKAEAMISRGGNSGIYFHVKFHEPGWFYDGHEVQINNTHADPVRTGSLWGVVKLHESPAKDNEWFRVNVRVQGRNVMVRINDKLVVDYDEPAGIPGPRHVGKGYFALQQHDPTGVVRFRNIMFKPLPPAAATGK